LSRFLPERNAPVLITIRIIASAAVLLVAVSLSAGSAGRAGDYASHQALAEASVPPFTAEIDADLMLSRSQRDLIQIEVQKLGRTFDSPDELLAESARVKKNILLLLNAKQRIRLDQLKIRYDGPLTSLLRTSLQRRLRIGNAQREKIRRLFLGYRKDLARIEKNREPGYLSGAERPVHLRELKNSYNKRALALLTDRQAELYRSLQGPPIQSLPEH